MLVDVCWLVVLQQDCEYDSVVLRSGFDDGGKDEDDDGGGGGGGGDGDAGDGGKVHGTFCGSTLPQPITSDGNKLRITFSTDNTVQKTGFSAVFFTGMCTHAPGCCDLVGGSTASLRRDGVSNRARVLFSLSGLRHRGITAVTGCHSARRCRSPPPTPSTRLPTKSQHAVISSLFSLLLCVCAISAFIGE